MNNRTVRQQVGLGDILLLKINTAIINKTVAPLGVDGVKISVRAPNSREWVETAFVDPLGVNRSGHISFLFGQTL